MTEVVRVHKIRYSDEPEKECGLSITMWCPGCKGIHRVQIVDPDTGARPRDGDTWEWNRRTDEGFTVSPSILAKFSVHLCEGEHGPVICPNPDDCGAPGHMVLNDDGTPHKVNEPEPTQRVLGHASPHTQDPAWGQCHSFVKDGKWQFLSDCNHELANRSGVPMVPVSEWPWGS